MIFLSSRLRSNGQKVSDKKMSGRVASRPHTSINKNLILILEVAEISPIVEMTVKWSVFLSSRFLLNGQKLNEFVKIGLPQER